jgi:hypothetical protein
MTSHGLQRAFERGILEDDIVHVINNPIQTIFDGERKNYKSYGRIFEPYTKDERILIVIHSELNTTVNIYTVMWTNRAGLRFYGFRDV